MATKNKTSQTTESAIAVEPVLAVVNCTLKSKYEKKKTKYNHKFDRIVINNRWKQPFYSRVGSWVIFGFGIRYFSPMEYEYYFNLFGIDIRVWFIRSLPNERSFTVSNLIILPGMISIPSLTMNEVDEDFASNLQDKLEVKGYSIDYVSLDDLGHISVRYRGSAYQTISGKHIEDLLSVLNDG